MKVKAITGVQVPMENQPHSYITENEAVEVENSLYYQRRLADGDLVLVEKPVEKSNAKTKEKGDDKQ